MTNNELNSYKWLDASEVKPQERPSNYENKIAKAFEKKLNSKVLDFLDMM